MIHESHGRELAELRQIGLFDRTVSPVAFAFATGPSSREGGDGNAVCENRPGQLSAPVEFCMRAEGRQVNTGQASRKVPSFAHSLATDRFR
jgi:hypothetical protein